MSAVRDLVVWRCVVVVALLVLVCCRQCNFNLCFLEGDVQLSLVCYPKGITELLFNFTDAVLRILLFLFYILILEFALCRVGVVALLVLVYCLQCNFNLCFLEGDVQLSLVCCARVITELL